MLHEMDAILTALQQDETSGVNADCVSGESRPLPCFGGVSCTSLNCYPTGPSSYWPLPPPPPPPPSPTDFLDAFMTEACCTLMRCNFIRRSVLLSGARKKKRRL